MAVGSTDEPLRCAGLNLILLAAVTAASSSRARVREPLGLRATPVGPEAHFQKDLAFQLKFAGLRGVHRLRLENDLYLGAGSATVILSVPSGI